MKKYVYQPALISFLLLTTSAVFAQDTAANDINIRVVGLTQGRLTAIATGLIALSALVRTLYNRIRLRNDGVPPRRPGLPVALATLAILMATTQLIVVRGAVFGSGSGKAGSIVAIILSLISLAIHWSDRKHIR